MSDPQIMKDMLSNIGHNNEIHRLCKISEILITKETNKTLKTYRFCLNAHGFKEEEIQAEIKSGEAGGREVYERTNDKDLLCKKDRESF